MTTKQDVITPKIDDSLLRAVKDVVAGSCGGMAQVLVGQPFNTVKVVRVNTCFP